MSADLDRVRLAKLLGMTTSSFDGEALTAMRRANELVKGGRTTWVEIIVMPGDAVQFLLGDVARLEAEVADLRDQLDRQRSRPRLLPFEQPESTDEAIALAIAWRHRLSPWEQQFLWSIGQRRRPLSAKQENVVWGMVNKIARWTMAGVA